LLCVSCDILIPFFLLAVASFSSFIHLQVVDPARISSYNNKEDEAAAESQTFVCFDCRFDMSASA
jgi:hypothetical protein